MRKLLLIASAVLVTLLCGVPETRADFILTFGQASYDVAPGGTVDVAVYLRETGGTVLATDGLFAAAFTVTFNESPFATDPAQVIGESPNPDFDTVTPHPVIPATSASAGSASMDLALFGPPFAVFPVAPATDEILLGTFRFQAGNVPGEQTRLSLAVLDPALDNFVTASGSVLDRSMTLGTSSISINTTAVPEPSSLVLMTAGIGCLIIGRRTSTGGRR